MRVHGYVGMAAVAALIVLSNAALAAHGKAGLWETTTTMAGNPKGFTMQFCMTEADVNSEKPTGMGGKKCKVTKTNVSGQTFTADMACTGAMTGTSHFAITYDKPEHYSGESDFAGNVSGQKFSTKTTFDGKWLKADCGSVKPYAPPK